MRWGITAQAVVSLVRIGFGRCVARAVSPSLSTGGTIPMNAEQLQAIEALKAVFPKLEVGVDGDDGLLVIITNAETDEAELVNQFGEYATIERK
jgi:hypothetical protein